MAITLVTGGAISDFAINGANVALTLPTLLQNDVVIVFGGHGHRTGADTIPTGYTQALAPHEGASDGTTPDFGVSYKVMGATPDTSVDCPGSGNTADAASYGAICLRGVDTSNVLDQTPTTAGETTSTNPDCPSITTVTNGAWVLPLAITIVRDTSGTAPTGYSNPIHQTAAVETNPATVMGATLAKATAGAEDPAAFTSVSSGIWFGVTLAIRPAPAGVTVAADAGSYAITGTAATLKIARKVVAGAGSYAITGTAASVLHKWKLAAAAGSYALTGTDADITHNTEVIIAADSGSYAITGTAASVYHSWRLAADAGSYAITGTDAGLVSLLKVIADAGSYALTGTDASPVQTRILGAGAGSYLITGTDAGVSYGFRLEAESGSYLISGVNVRFALNGWFIADEQPETWTERTKQSEIWTERTKQPEIWTAS